MKVYLAFSYKGDIAEIQGIFDTENGADKACFDKSCVYLEMEMNESLPQETSKNYLKSVCPRQNLVKFVGSDSWEEKI